MEAVGSIESLREYIPAYEELLADNLSLLLDRHARNPDYPFIDTKLNLISGEDFALRTAGRDIYSRDILYGWIQGRGLEALAAHLAWIPNAVSLPETRKISLERETRQLLASVMESMEPLRAKNGGRVHFMLSTAGTPLQINDQGEIQELERVPGTASFSDLFYAKGLYAAGQALGRPEICARAEAYLRQIIDAVLSGTFASGQQTMDPKNKVEAVPGRISHAPFMIALGGIGLLIESTASREWVDIGETLIRHVLQGHVNRGQFKDLRVWDFVEFLAPGGLPWRSDENVLCDPGHCIEFIGLSASVLLAARRTATPNESLNDLATECRKVLPSLFQHVFQLGFNAKQGGICKAYDLVSRQPINTDMPWWSLPETLRASALLIELWPGLRVQPLLTIYQQAHEAFFEHYVNPCVYSMAFQTRDINGHPVDVIPAVPDADPCYHTGLSILDVLEILYGF